MKVLVLAPHPDDETIGCGGTLLAHAKRGDQVVAVFLTSGELGLKHLPREKAWAIREAEARKAGKIIGLANLFFLRGPDWMLGDNIESAAGTLQPVLGAEHPELIYAPHENEWHPDHKAAVPILRRAVQNASLPAPEIRTYEVWTPLAEFVHVEDITPVINQKMKALRAYASQLKEFDYAHAVRGLNAFRGVTAAKKRYAEVFQSLPLEKP